MMKTEIRFLLDMVRTALHPECVPTLAPETTIDWKYVTELAKQHSILHILYYGLGTLPKEMQPDQERATYLYQCTMREAMRSCNQTEATEELLRECEKEHLYMMAVKGVCTKGRYPQAELRSMGDIDMLYQDYQDEKMRDVMSRLGYSMDAEGRKHDHYSRKPYINMEMHRELVATDSEYSTYYESVWKRAKPREGCSYIYEMSLEDEYIYNIIHLAEHFQNGGIGIRFLMDVHVYEQMADLDWSYVENEFKTLGLWEFYQNISRLSKKWFGDAEVDCDNVLETMEAYIVENGTFGSQKNQAAVSVSKEGKFAFLIKTVFPNLKNMQSMFPWLKKWPILLPVAWCVRIIRSLLFRKNNVKKQLEQYRYGDEAYGKELKKFFEECGL